MKLKKIVCIFSFVLMVLFIYPLEAHDRDSHADFVEIAIIYMLKNDDWELHKTAQIIGFTSPELADHKYSQNSLAEEAALVDTYEDLFLDLIRHDWKKTARKVVDPTGAVTNLVDAFRNAGKLKECFDSFGKFIGCAWALLFRSLLDYLTASNPILAGARIVMGGKEVGIDLITGDVQITEIAGQTFTAFMHFINVTEEDKDRKPGRKNDNRGFLRSVDDSQYAFTPTSPYFYGLVIAFLLADEFNTGVNYDASPALKNYKLNDSLLTKADYEDRDLKDVEFEPVDNLATYGYNQFMYSDGGIKANILQLGRVLHAAADCSVFEHARGWLAGEDSQFEARCLSLLSKQRAVYIDLVETVWDKYIEDNKTGIEHYLDKLKEKCRIPELLTETAKIAHREYEEYNSKGKNFEQGSLDLAVASTVKSLVCIFREYFKDEWNEDLDPEKTGLKNSGNQNPESNHPLGSGEPDDDKWAWISSDSYEAVDLIFDENTEGKEGETLIIKIYTDPEMTNSRECGPISLDDLSGSCLRLTGPGIYGVGLTLDPSITELQGDSWGFRIKNIVKHKTTPETECENILVCDEKVPQVSDKFSGSFHLGFTVPYANLSYQYKPGLSMDVDLELKLSQVSSFLLFTGYKRFSGKQGGSTTFINLNANLKYYINNRKKGGLFINGGMGLYLPHSNSLQVGGNLGFGYRFNISGKTIESWYNFHWIKTQDNTTFSSVQIGFIFDF